MPIKAKKQLLKSSCSENILFDHEDILTSELLSQILYQTNYNIGYDAYLPSKIVIELEPSGREFKATKKTNGKECLYHNEDQVLFAMFKYIIDNPPHK